MFPRRQFVISSAALPAGLIAPAAFASGANSELTYAEAVASTWRGAEGAAHETPALLMQELVRFATLAPSSHNTQCWRFRIEENKIAILPDLSRRCPAVDPDDHHLFVSLGCAAENLQQAALAHGLMAEASFDAADSDGVLNMALQPTKRVESPLFEAIVHRQSTRSEFDGRALANEQLDLLERAGRGNGVRVQLLTDPQSRERVLEWVVQANTEQINDDAFVAELKSWIRFNDAEAVATGDGLFSRTTGNPTVPRWIGSPLFGFLYTPGNENDKYTKQLRSSAGIAVFISAASDKAHWLEVGRCFERFALQATALGIRNALVNQPVEVARLRPQFAQSLGIGSERPDLIVRFGRAPAMPRSLRRPVAAVLV